MIVLLNQRLADVIDLGLQAKQAHWNVKGPHFIGLHELFDKLAKELEEFTDETVLLSDSMAHLPREVLSKNFGVAEDALKNLPKQELFIFQTEVPGPLEDDQKAAAGSLSASPRDFAFRTMD